MWRFDWKVGSGDGFFFSCCRVLFIRQSGTRRGETVGWELLGTLEVAGGGRKKVKDGTVKCLFRGEVSPSTLRFWTWAECCNKRIGSSQQQIQKAASRSRNAGLGALQVVQVVQVEVRGPKRERKRGAQRSSEGEGDEGEDKRKKWRVSAEDQMRGSRQAIVFLVRAAGGGK